MLLSHCCTDRWMLKEQTCIVPPDTIKSRKCPCPLITFKSPDLICQRHRLAGSLSYSKSQMRHNINSGRTGFGPYLQSSDPRDLWFKLVEVFASVMTIKSSNQPSNQFEHCHFVCTFSSFCHTWKATFLF